MNDRQKQLITDNPNLSSSKLSRFLGVSRIEIDKIRGATNWRHSGLGIPFLSQSIGKNGLSYKLRTKNITVVSCSSFNGAMENLDRLISCLENNDGNLPMSTKEFIYCNLEFIK